MTFDLISELDIGKKYDWQNWFEVFCICRNCNKSTVFVLSQKAYEAGLLLERTSLSDLNTSVNQVMNVEGFISLKDIAVQQPPEHVPQNIEAAFKEGSACAAISCYNAAAAMFRLCIDLATEGMLPEENVNGLNAKIRRSLGLRLQWLFEHKVLPEGLRRLSACIKDDGNDGAHEGSLSREDANDILDFTYILLERLYTEPKRIELAEKRRIDRRTKT